MLCGLSCIFLSPEIPSHLSHLASSGAQIPPLIVLHPSRSLLSTLPGDTRLKTLFKPTASDFTALQLALKSLPVNLDHQAETSGNATSSKAGCVGEEHL